MNEGLTTKEKSPLEQAIFNLYLWQCAESTSFTATLYHLISKADAENREKIRVGFPFNVAAFELWEAAPNEKKFFESWGCAK